jgi:hypothetical protein
MYIATVPNRKSPPAILLRESYRDKGKVKTRTIANLTHWAPERVEALRRALKGDFDGMDGEEVSGEIFGVLFALKQLADQVGLTRVLGPSEEGRWVRPCNNVLISSIQNQIGRSSARTEPSVRRC